VINICLQSLCALAVVVLSACTDAGGFGIFTTCYCTESHVCFCLFAAVDGCEFWFKTVLGKVDILGVFQVIHLLQH